MEQPPTQPPPEQPPPRQQPPYQQQPPFQQQGGYYQQAPFMQPPIMPYDPGLRSKAIRGNILMFGLVGFALVIVGFFVSTFMSSEIVFGCNFLAVPILVGLLAGNAAINGRLADNSSQAAMQGAGAAGFTAVLFASICMTCSLLSTILLVDASSQSGYSLNEIFRQADQSAAFLVLIYLGFWVVGILVYSALGALGAVVAGLLKGV